MTTMVASPPQQGRLTEVSLRVIGSEASQDHALGASTLFLHDTTDFADDGGSLLIQVDIDETYTLTYTSKDDDVNTITLVGTLPVAVDSDTQVFVYPLATEKYAQVQIDEDEEPIVARIPYALSAGVDEGVRDATSYESVMVELQAGYEYVVSDFPGKEDYIDGVALDPATVPPAGSSPISVGPAISASAGYNSIFVSWSPVLPDDTSYTGFVSYEVHVSSTNGFTPGPTTLYSRTISPNVLITQMPSGSALSTSAPTYVKVRAYTTNEVSPWSNETSATALAGADPAAISALQAKFPINTVDIANGAVIGTKITDGTITTAKIGPNQVTTALLAANSVTANEMAAGAVTANKLSVIMGGGNLVQDSSFETSATYSLRSAWVQNAGATMAKDTAQARFTGVQSLKVTPAGVENWGYYAPDGGSSGGVTRITGILGEKYAASVYVYADTAQNMALYNYGAPNVAGPTVAVPANTWTRLTLTYTHGSTNFLSPRVPGRGSALLGNFWLDDFQIELGDVVTAYAPATNEILPGTILAVHVATDTLTATQIASSAITANELAANSVVAGKIAALTITAAEIAANTITAAKIAAGTITANEIAAGTITATQIAAGTITGTLLSATAIDAMTITGAIFQTASSGQRMVMQNDTSGGVLKFYSGLSSDVAGFINPSIQGSSPNQIPTLAIQTGTANGFNVAPTLYLRAGGHTASVDSAVSIQILLPDSLNGASGTQTGQLIIQKTTGGAIQHTFRANGDYVSNGAVEAQQVFIDNPATTTSAANLRMGAAGQQIAANFSLSRMKLQQEPLELERLKKLLDIPIISWYDKEEYKANNKSTEGLRRIPGTTAEAVAKIDPLFADYYDNKLSSVLYDRIGIATLPMIKDLYQELDKLKKEVASLKAA